MESSAKSTALLVGATGMVGKEVLHILLADAHYEKVTVVVRSILPISHNKLTQVAVPDFDNLENYASRLQAQTVFCCLGTTLKQAGSRQGFYKVDYTYTLKVAQIAYSLGAQHFVLVSAIGASLSSWFYYSRTKAEVEEAISKLGYSHVSVVRPSLLLGHRETKRVGEEIGIAIDKILKPIWVGTFKKYKGIPATTVARAMIYVARYGQTGFHIYESDKLFELSNSLQL